MKRLLSAASILAIAGVAQGSAFNSLGYQGGGGLAGITGQGLTVTGGFFFDAPATANLVPAAANGFTAANFTEFDSYFGLDPQGPSARNRSTAAPSNNSTRTLTFYGDYGPAGAAAANYDVGEYAAGYTATFGSGSHIGDLTGTNPPATPDNRARVGIGVSANAGTGVPPVPSGFAPNATGGRSTLNGVFLGRMTVTQGSLLTGALDFTILQTAATPGTSETHELVLGGAPVMFTTHTGPQLLALRAYLIAGGAVRAPLDITAAGLADPNGVNDSSAFGLADAYDLWVQIIPTPGALALIGLGGIAALRRRRA